MISGLIGGALIGLAGAILLLWNGRILGVSGILGRTLEERAPWRLAFLGAVVGTGVLIRLVVPDAFDSVIPASLLRIVGAGLLVGYGTSLGGGCTSGHGVCGLGRLSLRSLVATGAFLAAGIIVVGFFS